MQFVGAMQDGPMVVLGLLRGHREAAVEVFTVPPEEGVGGFEVADVTQAQFLHQAVLQGLVGPFDTALGLWRARVDGLDVEGPHGAPELGQDVGLVGQVVAEDPVAVGVQGDRPPMLAEVVAEGLHVGLRGLGGDHAQRHQGAGGSSMKTISVQRGPRSSNQSWGEPSISISSP